jgi:tripartite ATP-independent transporter DctP family solute receptor
MKMFKSTMLLVAACLVSASAFADSAKTTGDNSPKTIKWVLAHEPVRLFKDAAVKFSDEVKVRSGGRINVEVMTLPEYESKYADGKKLSYTDVVRLIQNGKIEMSQTYTTSLGTLEKDMYVLDLPFLFRDHQHASKVLEGKVGQKLLAGMESSHVHGLAFTYSGGYRVIPANTAINKVEDFKGMKIRTSNSPVAQDTFLLLGAKPMPMDLDDVANATKRGLIVGAESTYPRFYEMKQNEYSKVLNDTKHSLFLTSIVINNEFWASLTPELKKAVEDSAVSAARLERTQSIADAEVTKAKCREDGIQVVELPANEQKKMKEKTQGLYKKYESYFSPQLIKQIQND